MKKFGCILTALLLCLSLIAHAEGLTLYTVSSFAGTDAAADSYVGPGTQYVTYVLGEGAISFEDIGDKVPYEMARDPATDGGVDTLYTRQRKVFAPFGVSYEKTSQTTLSPTDAELSNGANWVLVHSGEAEENNRSYIAHKAIPIARILSRG